MGMTFEQFEYKLSELRDKRIKYKEDGLGMSIDEAIGLLERGSQYNYYDSAEDFCKAYDMSIDTMRKYQKIQEIINNAKDSDGAIRFNWLYERIKEVLEDGKID